MAPCRCRGGRKEGDVHHVRGSTARVRRLRIPSCVEYASEGTAERMRETSDEEEEMRYLIKGRDFCIDLCGMLDVLTPYMNMMIRVQGLNPLATNTPKTERG